MRPYVFVGHSSGGLSVRLYAYTYSSDVVGMVLVDPTVEDQKAAYRSLDPKKRTAEQWDADTVEPGLEDLRACVVGAIAGFVPDSELFNWVARQHVNLQRVGTLKLAAP